MKIGSTVYLEGEGDRLRSRLVEEREDELCIDLPIHMKTGRTSSVTQGTRFKASLVTDDGQLYTFTTEVVGRELKQLPMLLLKHPKEQTVREQRRKFIRIPAFVDVAVHPKKERFVPFTATTVNLSAGGAAVRLPKQHPLKESMEIRCWFVLHMQSEEIFYLCLDCAVRRIRDEERKEWHQTAQLQFLSEGDKERQRVIRFCFEQQLMLKRKGLEGIE